MNLTDIFDVFSRRTTDTEKPIKPLTPEFRNRVMLFCTKRFRVYRQQSSTHALWTEIRDSLLICRGWIRLAKDKTQSDAQDVIAYLAEGEDAHFLDFIELLFKCEAVKKNAELTKIIIDDFNKFLEIDNLPYALTEYRCKNNFQGIWFKVPEGVVDNPPRIEVFPQIIRRDSEVLHNTAIKPTLELLSQPYFANANKVFLAALEDYRKGDYEDCVTRCCSSFESVLKVICDRKGWKYGEGATAKRLINVVLCNANLPEFFKQPLALIADTRNKLGSAHGGGAEEREVPWHYAKFVINVTASAMLLIVDETTP